MRTLTLCGSLLLAFLSPTAAQDSTPPLDGAKHILRDDLLEKMTGTWQLTGTIRGRNVRHSVEASWVLNHQFLQIHERDNADPARSESWYEAIVLVGRDNMGERYVAHWNDIYGGRVSETLGYGTRSDNAITFVFEYPEGPFRTTFRWMPDLKQWEWLMRAKNAKGQWEEFARMTLARSAESTK